MIKLNTKTVVLIILIVLFFLTGFFVSKHFSDKRKQEILRELKTEKIKNDTLVKIDSTTYKKLVADTLTKKQLEKKVKDLKIKVKNAQTASTVSFKPKDIKKQTDTVYRTKDTTINTVDYYPNKEKPFVRYSSILSLKDTTSISNWKFYKQRFSLVVAKDKDGLYKVVTKVPKFIEITDVDVLSQPKEKTKKDNFGFLVGAGYGKDLNIEKDFVSFNTGIRYKKTYLNLNITTNNTINLGLSYEF